MLISYIKGLLASSWLGKLMPLINIPSKSARRGTREPELHSVKGEGGEEARETLSGQLCHRFPPRSSTASKNRGEFCILRLCFSRRGGNAACIRLFAGRIVDRDERSSHSNFCIFSFELARPAARVLKRRETRRGSRAIGNRIGAALEGRNSKSTRSKENDA